MGRDHLDGPTADLAPLALIPDHYSPGEEAQFGRHLAQGRGFTFAVCGLPEIRTPA